MQDAKARPLQFGLELAARIAPLMQCSVIRRAPQPWVLRDGNHRSPSRLEGGADFGEDVFVLTDMLDDIKGADDVKFLAGGDQTRIHLHQGDAFTEALARED